MPPPGTHRGVSKPIPLSSWVCWAAQALDETLGSAPPGECLTWVLAQAAGTLTDARRKYKEIRLIFFYVPLKLVSFLVILHVTYIDR